MAASAQTGWRCVLPAKWIPERPLRHGPPGRAGPRPSEVDQLFQQGQCMELVSPHWRGLSARVCYCMAGALLPSIRGQVAKLARRDPKNAETFVVVGERRLKLKATTAAALAALQALARELDPKGEGAQSTGPGAIHTSIVLSVSGHTGRYQVTRNTEERTGTARKFRSRPSSSVVVSDSRPPHSGCAIGPLT